ncbi:chromatin associated protein KTI12-domain-containing protein [Cunninghamella echinulata]|nr:chromatin associated protein KTI12-domain-containing protein [Cunninghamella echinulata]
MPLIIITGFPSSGKSKRALEVESYLKQRLEDEKKSMRIHLINDESLHVSKEAYKGFRYQLYCVARALSTPHCVIHAGTPSPLAKEWNSLRGEQAYDEQVFDELVTRYEEPEGRNRWDSPLFTIIYDDVDIPGDKIWDAVILRKPPPPNFSTVSKPVSDTNYVYELDRITLEIINAIIEGQKEHGAGGLPMNMPNSTSKVINPSRILTLSELRRLRKQFVSYNKIRTTQDMSRLSNMFIDFLNTNLS